MTTDSTKTKARTRSPAYPSLDLESAIERAQIIYQKEGRNAAHVEVLVEHWGYERGSSNGMRAIAALLQFGLLEDEGKKEERKAKLTRLALDILVPSDDPSHRQQAIREAAILPPLHKELWDKYAENLPSDANLRRYLLLERDFNEKAVDPFVRQFRTTLAYADLPSSDTIDDNNEPSKDTPVRIGDYVQWCLRGQGQFFPPKKVLGTSPDGLFAFVEGVETGVPMNELAVQETPSTTTTTLPPSLCGVTTQPPASPFFKPKLTEDEAERSDTVKAILPLIEGAAVLTMPAKMSEDSALDLQSWIELMVAQTLRKAGVKPKSE
jgi:hypothetical protein